jgi:hypothetical protein
MSKYFKLAVFSFFLGAASMLVVSPVTASSAHRQVAFGVRDVAQAATCGDGICDAYVGENKTTCSADCGSNTTVSNPTAVPTATPVTPTATTTVIPQLILPAFSTTTPAAAGSASPGPTGNGTGTATGDPSGTPPADISSIQAGCEYVSYESRTADWQTGYSSYAKEFIPKQVDQREVFVCRVPPLGRVCLPVYDGLANSVDGNLDKVTLVDCTAGGECVVHDSKLKMVGGMLCADITVAGSVSCTGGCALAPASDSLLTPPDFAGLLASLPAGAIVPIACFLSLLLIGAVGFLIFVTRRARQRELDEDGAAAD